MERQTKFFFSFVSPFSFHPARLSSRGWAGDKNNALKEICEVLSSLRGLEISVILSRIEAQGTLAS
jgi:hypothetical protein